MSDKKIWFVTIILSVILLACSQKEADMLRITSSLPLGERSSSNPFIFTFSKGVVPVESVGVMMKTPFVTFTPEIPGMYIWQDTVTLVFSPDSMLKGDTHYKGAFNTALLLKYSGMKSFDERESFEFSTESFRLKGAEFFYDRLGGNRAIGVKANLEFTYAVNPADLQKSIKITIDNVVQTGITVMTLQASRIIPVEVGVVTQTEKDKTILVEVDRQLTSPETGTPIKMEKPFEFRLPGIGELKIYGHECGFDGEMGWITINTSQEVDSSSAREYITFNPSRSFSLVGTRNSITLRGKFEPGSTFHLKIAKGMQSVLEAKTQNDYEADIIIGNIKPSFQFASSGGMYLLSGGQKNIEIKTMNLSRLFVRVSQVFQNNLVFFLESGRQYDWWYDDYEGEDGGGYRAPKYRFYLGNYGRQLNADTISLNSLSNQEVSTLLDVSPYIRTDYKGFLLVEIANPEQPWRLTSKLISLSNIGLIVKQSANEVTVFATDLQTTKPMEGVRINLISSSNQTIATATTTAEGVARIENFREMKKDFALALITAERGEDFNFINLADYRVETSRFDVAGKYENENLYDAMLYGDRTLYRPGETIHVSGIVRNLNNALPDRMPVKIKIFSPRGTTVKELQQTLNEQGSFDLSYPTSPTSLSGTYRIELQTGNAMFLANYFVSVEDFVPDRIKVNLTASREQAQPGDKITYELEALNFFGPPAAGRNYEFEGTYQELPYYSKNFRDFRFSDASAKSYSGSPAIVTGKTNTEGKATIDFVLPYELTSPAILKARGRVAVFDESGRPVYQIASTLVYPKPYLIGIKNRGDYYIRPNSPQQVQFIAVGTDDKAIEGFKATVQIIRLEWHSVLRQYQGTGTLRYVSEQREIIEKTEDIVLGSQPYTYRYMTSRSGDYRVRISKTGDSGYNQFSFYSYSWGTTDITSFEIDPEARVDIVLNDSVYTPGEKAKILFKTPFSGTMLVTIERNQVYSYRYLTVENNAASLEIPVEDRFLPNVYISAVLFRKITDMNIPLLVGHGFAPLMVERQSNRLAVTIKAPERIRPKTKQTVTVQAGSESNIFVTLAAVDEGILQLKNYQTPNPYKYFYARKALQTETFDFFKHLLPEIRRGSSGGGDAELGQRVNPLGVRRFKPLALWSGILKTNGNGEASISLDVPEFNGELRLMALAYKGDRFGSAQKPMKVSDPVVITPALPRFASPGDSVIMPITAFNTTDKPVKLKFDVETTGGLVVAGKPDVLELGANQERFVSVPLRATKQIGKATVKVTTSAFGETIESMTKIPIRPIAPYISEAISRSLDGNQSVTHTITDAYLPNGRKAYLTMSPFPVANFAKQLKNLIGYPHGCLEQTVSKAFPQIYLRDIAILLDPSILNNGSPAYFVNEAITKVGSMQMQNGEFSYWPGGDYSNRWTTVYATHFLIEAKKAGYAVPEPTLNAALAQCKFIARSKETQDYYSYGPGGRETVRRIADKTSLYALYVLAIAGTPDLTLMNFYRTEKNLLTTDTRYMLSAAFALSGDRRTSVELLPPEFVTEEPNRQSGGDFDSPIRANAIILNVLLESDLNNPKVTMYMDYLSKAYSSDRWYSTQDDAFTLLAFGKAARMASAAKATGVITVGGKTYKYIGGTQKFDLDPFGKDVVISVQSEGRVYYSLVTTGIRSDGSIPVEDKIANPEGVFPSRRIPRRCTNCETERTFRRQVNPECKCFPDRQYCDLGFTASRF